jgi:hypothetical protein
MGGCHDVIPSRPMAIRPSNRTRASMDGLAWFILPLNPHGSLWVFGSMRLFMASAEQFRAAGWEYAQSALRSAACCRRHQNQPIRRDMIGRWECAKRVGSGRCERGHCPTSLLPFGATFVRRAGQPSITRHCPAIGQVARQYFLEEHIGGLVIPRRGAHRWMQLANSRPNIRPHQRIVSHVTETPRAARISSTMRRLSRNRNTAKPLG